MTGERNKPKAIIIIGGSYLQLPQIRWARELGLHVIVTDKNPEVPGREMANRFVRVDGTDIDGFIKLASEVNRAYQLIGVYASSDFGLATVAAVSQALGLPGCPPGGIEKALNKSKAREIWLTNGLSVPRGVKVHSQAAAVEAILEIGLPAIVKPVNGSGSRGVRSINNRSDLREAFAEAQSVSDEVLVEELIGGRHIDVNGLIIGGTFYGCGISERFFSTRPFHYPLWGYQEAELSDEQKSKTYQLVDRAARCLGIELGPVKADVILTKAGPFLIELSPRFHGDIGTSFVTPLATGMSPIQAYFAFLAGEEDFSDFLQPDFSQLAGWMALFPTDHGRLSAIEGLDKVKAMKDIAHVFIKACPGQKVNQPKDNTSLYGFIVARGENRKQLNTLLKTAAENLEFICH